jgi:hypothetical protein
LPSSRESLRIWLECDLFPTPERRLPAVSTGVNKVP